MSLYVDYSTCITLGQHSSFFQSLEPSLVNATKMDIGNKGLWVVNRVKLLSTFAVNERGNRTAVWVGPFGQPILQICDEISVGAII